MRYRKFGKLDWKVSALGFGCMRLPEAKSGPPDIDEAEAIRMIRYAIDHGVNYVDTAYPYHGGQSERVLGKALRDGYREKVKLADKMPLFNIQSADEFDRFFNEQLERLNLPKVDFYLLHGLNKNSWHKARDLGIIKWAEKRMANGYFDYFCFSFHDDFETLKEIIEAYDNWTFAQVLYNYMDVNRQAGTRGVKYAASKGLGVVVMEPVRGGMLSRKPPEAVAKIWQGAPHQRTLAGWALQWVWNQPEISVALSGMTTMEQVVENVASASRSGVGKLSKEELDLYPKVREAFQKANPVSCTGCRYCQPCPNGVDIPGIFELYNDAMVFDTANMARQRYQSPMLEGHRADACQECDKCLELCPQKIAIPEVLKKVHEYLNNPKVSRPGGPGGPRRP